MKIVINVDASFNKKKIAAWAYWIETPTGILKDSGLFPQKVDNSSVAELLAFERAFRRLESEYPATKFDLTVNSDSMWVVKGLMGHVIQYRGIQPRHISLCQSVAHAVKAHNLTTFHVKSHGSHLRTAEQMANNWCDFNARELLRKELRR